MAPTGGMEYERSACIGRLHRTPDADDLTAGLAPEGFGRAARRGRLLQERLHAAEGFFQVFHAGSEAEPHAVVVAEVAARDYANVSVFQ